MWDAEGWGADKRLHTHQTAQHIDFPLKLRHFNVIYGVLPHDPPNPTGYKVHSGRTGNAVFIVFAVG